MNYTTCHTATLECMPHDLSVIRRKPAFFSLRKFGGIRFLRIGKLSVSFCITK